MIGQLLALLFLSREVAHRAHLSTTSYAQHVALQGFYEGIVDLTDSLAETFQGRNGIIQDIPILDAEAKGDIVATLQEHLDWIEKNRTEAIPADETSMHNILDEVVALYLRTLYKLKNLK